MLYDESPPKLIFRFDDCKAGDSSGKKKDNNDFSVRPGSSPPSSCAAARPGDFIILHSIFNPCLRKSTKDLR
jgi:hypothetical protein